MWYEERVPTARPVNYLPQIDALRFAAFSMVFGVHALAGAAAAHPISGTLVGAGRFGVDLFFVISGFVITRSIGDDTLKFWKRRARRLLPLYFLAALAMAPILDPLHIFGVFTFTENIVMTFAGSPGFVAAPLWSLALEVQFYLFYPLLLKRWKPANIAVAMIACSLALRLIWAAAGIAPEGAWMFPLTRLDAFGAGILLATCRLPKIPAALPLGIAGIILSEMLLQSALWPLAYSLAALSAGLVVQGIRSAPESLAALGRPTYGAYLLHAPLIALASGTSGFLQLASYGLALMATLGVAALSHRFVEPLFYCSRPYAWRSSTTALSSWAVSSAKTRKFS